MEKNIIIKHEIVKTDEGDISYFLIQITFKESFFYADENDIDHEANFLNNTVTSQFSFYSFILNIIEILKSNGMYIPRKDLLDFYEKISKRLENEEAPIIDFSSEDEKTIARKYFQVNGTERMELRFLREKEQFLKSLTVVDNESPQSPIYPEKPKKEGVTG